MACMRMPLHALQHMRGAHADDQHLCTRVQVGVRDDRFQAVQTLRLIGYALASVGHPCRRLWDPEQPHAWLYGRAHARMCAAL